MKRAHYALVVSNQEYVNSLIRELPIQILRYTQIHKAKTIQMLFIIISNWRYLNDKILI